MLGAPRAARHGGLEELARLPSVGVPWVAPARVRAGALRRAGYGAAPGAKAERKENMAQGGSREHARALVVQKCLCGAWEHGGALRSHPGKD